MEATQTDVEYPQSSDLVDGQIDGIAGGIMDLIDTTDPRVSGVVEAKRETKDPEPPKAEAQKEEPAEEKYTIKWQGQERDVTQEELLDLAQKGFDYTQKTQALAQERDQLAPYHGLANRIKSDPNLANQIAELLSGKTQREPEKPKFEDPIEQLKWETKQETLAEVRKEMQQAVLPIHRQQALSQIRAQVQADPDYREIHQQIIEMVQSQPPAVQKTVYLQLDQDPKAYLDAFQYFKNRKAQQPVTPMPKPSKKETRAPILEAGGVAAPEGIEGKARAEKISKQKAKALRTGDPSAIADWLTASGAIDHLY